MSGARRFASRRWADDAQKDLEDGGIAHGFLTAARRSNDPFDKLRRPRLSGRVRVRDLWRQAYLPDANGHLPSPCRRTASAG
jgi:hypothetical protein